MLEEIIQVINTTGFPIFCVLALGYFVKYMFDQMNTIQKDLKESLEKNTAILNRVCELLRIGEEGEK